jgi:glutathione S-transferase
MKLYFSPGACALHPQIALRETGLDFELVRVDLRAHKLQDGTDFYSINPKGYVPLLELADGTRLTEGAIIDQFVADKNPGTKILPAVGTMERVRVQEWLHFIATELHKQFSPLFNPQLSDDDKSAARKKLGNRFDYIERELGKKSFLMGDQFTVADGYLFNMLRWTQFTGIDLSNWPGLSAYSARLEARPSVKASLEAERAKG